jgi:hypothetical protein
MNRPCPLSCRCWPRPEHPFTPFEQTFLNLLCMEMGKEQPTKWILSMLDPLAQRLGRDRLGYLLSVPLRGADDHCFTAWAWITEQFTPDPALALVFTEKMLTCRACTRFAGQRSGGSRAWWKGQSSHPGRFVMLSDAYSAFDYADKDHMGACLPPMRQAARVWAAQALRWDYRKARRLWFVCKQGCTSG